MTPDRIRLFVAATVPDDRLRALDEGLDDLKASLSDARWTKVENQHVTLKFLGSTEADSLSTVSAACAEVSAAHLRNRVSLAGLGAFPNERRARVLWAGIDDQERILASIAAALDGSLAPLGFLAEKRAFTPHLTLARFRTPGRLPELPPVPPASQVPFEIADIVLFRSHLSPRGARYEALEHFPLAT